MMKKGKLTICRHGIIDEDYISLQISDKNSSKPVIEAKISLENFMRALTNLQVLKWSIKLDRNFQNFGGRRLR